MFSIDQAINKGLKKKKSISQFIAKIAKGKYMGLVVNILELSLKIEPELNSR